MRETELQWNTTKDLHVPYSKVSLRMTLSYNDTKHLAASATAELLLKIFRCYIQ